MNPGTLCTSECHSYLKIRITERLPECGKEVGRTTHKLGVLNLKLHITREESSYQVWWAIPQDVRLLLDTSRIFHVGVSKSCVSFIRKHAEAICADYTTLGFLKAYAESVREAANAAGGDPTAIKIFAETGCQSSVAKRKRRRPSMRKRRRRSISKGVWLSSAAMRIRILQNGLWTRSSS
jgi:hypothetical protein